jgi:leucyl-tRNA---protein transferase
MFSNIRYPDKVEPEELDRYLARGWRPMGQYVYTSHFHHFGGEEIFSTICTRLPLKGYQFRKSLRKLVNRNRGKFRVEVRDATLTPAKEALNERYKKVFPEKGVFSLSFFLGEYGTNVYQTKEVAIYHGRKLVALSFFDVGREGMYSKAGIYDPEYRNYSLGFYTMLEEIAYGLETGRKYYYPGYVVPGYPIFDYKLRIGDVEYLDIARKLWRPFKELKPEDIPILRMRLMLGQLQELLGRQGMESRFYYYQHFDLRRFEMGANNYLRFPAFLLIQTSQYFDSVPIVVFNPVKGKYQLIRCRFMNRFFDHASCYEAYMNDVEARICRVLLARRDTEMSAEDPAEIAERLRLDSQIVK